MAVTINGSTGITTNGITDTTGTDALNNVTANTLTTTGNVGIGTTSPGTILQVSKASTSTTVGSSTSVISVVNSQSSSLGETSGIEFFNRNTSGSAKLAAVYGLYENYNVTGYAGSLVFATESAGASNVAERMRIDSSGIITGTAGNLMLVQNTSRITLASTATVISTAIPSWAKRIVLNIVGMSSSSTADYLVQIGSGSYTSTGYLGSAVATATSGAAKTSTAGFIIVNNDGAAQVSHVTMTINLQNAATNTWSASHSGGCSNRAQALVGGGSVSLGGTLDRLQITTTSTDTFSAGTINFQYE